MPTSASRVRMFAVLVPLLATTLSLAVMEVGLRLAIFSDVLAVPKLRQARHYADSWLDDDFWKLEFLFNDAGRQETGRDPGQVHYVRHPQLGWAPEVTTANPLGIVTDQAYTPDRLEPSVLFFGDSYVDGPEPIPSKIPQLLDPLLEDRRVLNYGVSGYGVDQIYLRFVDVLSRHDHPMVLIGIQDRDLDRTILSIRNQQKPLLDIENGELIVRNAPIGDTAEFIERNPVELNSYLLRLVLLRLRGLGAEPLVDRMLGYDERQELKLRLNRRILEAFKERALESGISLYVVLFYVENDIYEESWRETFLKDTLDELAIPYFDTKSYLLAHLAAKGGTVGDYWSDAHGHPNHDGNLLFAEGIADWLKQQETESSIARN